MLIKSVGKNGTAVPLSPEEALVPAVAIGLSENNNAEFVYWISDKNLKTAAFSSTLKDAGEYDAFAEGTCNVGKTRVKDDKFFVEKPHSFKIHYKSAKDAIGAPHVKIVSFNFSPLESNPSNMVGEVDRTNSSIRLMGEIRPVEQQSVGGKIHRRK